MNNYGYKANISRRLQPPSTYPAVHGHHKGVRILKGRFMARLAQQVDLVKPGQPASQGAPMIRL
jgi:hypothetical protein